MGFSVDRIKSLERSETEADNMTTAQSESAHPAFPIAAAQRCHRSLVLASGEDLAVRERSACDARQVEDLARDDAEP
jgi:hypothetical protein